MYQLLYSFQPSTAVFYLPFSVPEAPLRWSLSVVLEWRVVCCMAVSGSLTVCDSRSGAVLTLSLCDCLRC